MIRFWIGRNKIFEWMNEWFQIFTSPVQVEAVIWLTNYLTMKENDTKKLKYVPNLLKQVRNEILKAQRKF